MRLLALDPGNKFTGYAVFADGKLVDAGVIKIPAKARSADRYNWVFEALVQLTTELGPFHGSVVEVPSWAGTYNVHRNPKSVAGLYSFIGATLLSLERLAPPCDTIPARRVSKDHRREIVALWLKSDGVPMPEEADAIDAIYAGFDYLGRDRSDRA